MDENEMHGLDEGEGTGTGDILSVGSTEQIILDTSEVATEISVLEAKFDVLTEKVTGCYCLLLILAVLGLRNVFRSIIRKVRGGLEDV